MYNVTCHRHRKYFIGMAYTQTAEYGSFRQDLGCAKDQNLGAGAQKMVRCAGKSIPGAQNIFKCA